MKRILIPVLLPVFLLLSGIPADKFRSKENYDQWEADIARFDSLNHIENSDENTLLVTGSSSIRLWDSIHTDLAPFQVMQRGYGGAKISDYCYYAERIIKPHSFKAIVIFIANDITGGEGDKSPDEVFTLYKNLVKQLRQRNGNTPLFWIEVTPTPSRWEGNQKVQEASSLIRDYCDKKGSLYFIDTYDCFLTSEGLPDPDWFRSDMLHLNREGYLHWTSIIREALLANGITP